MSITIQVSHQVPQPCTESKVESIDDLFRQAFPGECLRSRSIVQTSLTRSEIREGHILPSTNGFIWAVVRAYLYNNHQHLILRPDDVWLAMLSQLSFFMNAHFQDLRRGNIIHRGTKHLKIEDEASEDYSDFAIMSARMVRLMGDYTTIPAFYDWMAPEFSTTRGPDIEAATILILGARRKYFKYEVHKKCGIPSITLEGTREDWENILDRVRIIQQIGAALHERPEHRWEPIRFQRLLEPVIRGIIDSYTAPESVSTKAFWNQIMGPCSDDCGTQMLSGWVSAFCFWDEDGRCFYGDKRASERGIIVAGVQYHSISMDLIPSGVASFTILVNDQDEHYKAELLAGFLGVRVSSGSKTNVPALDSVQPLTGWIMSELRDDVDDEEEAPVPRHFLYYDDFNEEAPLPAPFVYEEEMNSNSGEELDELLPQGETAPTSSTHMSPGSFVDDKPKNMPMQTVDQT